MYKRKKDRGSISVRSEIYASLKAHSKRTRRSISTIVDELISNYLDRVVPKG